MRLLIFILLCWMRLLYVYACRTIASVYVCEWKGIFRNICILFEPKQQHHIIKTEIEIEEWKKRLHSNIVNICIRTKFIQLLKGKGDDMMVWYFECSFFVVVLYLYLHWKFVKLKIFWVKWKKRKINRERKCQVRFSLCLVIPFLPSFLYLSYLCERYFQLLNNSQIIHHTSTMSTTRDHHQNHPKHQQKVSPFSVNDRQQKHRIIKIVNRIKPFIDQTHLTQVIITIGHYQ